jgi:hypothetical protein
MNSVDHDPSCDPNSPSTNQKCLEFYGTRRFIVRLQRARYGYYPESDEPSPQTSHLIYAMFILILSSHLHPGLQSSLFPLNPLNKTLNVFFLQ